MQREDGGQLVFLNQDIAGQDGGNGGTASTTMWPTLRPSTRVVVQAPRCVLVQARKGSTSTARTMTTMAQARKGSTPQASIASPRPSTNNCGEGAMQRLVGWCSKRQSRATMNVPPQSAVRCEGCSSSRIAPQSGLAKAMALVSRAKFEEHMRLAGKIVKTCGISSCGAIARRLGDGAQHHYLLEDEEWCNVCRFRLGLAVSPASFSECL